MAYDPTAVSHQEWLGYVQPVGVVVSIPALLEAGAAINRHFVPLHKEFLSVLPQDSDGSTIPKLTDFQRFATDVLKWRPQDLEGPDESLTIAVPGYEEVLHPDYVVKDAGSPLLLISKTGADFDTVPPPEPRHWHASPQARFERLLRETGIPSGLLVSPDAIRLVYSPKGESSGHITFKIAEMAQVAGRPILAALHMLLSAERLFTLAQDQRLPALLVASRKHQNVVSNKLSGQVMEALFDLLRGFQAAHDQTGILAQVLRDDPNQVYAGLLTVLLRLVFILYAEHRDLLSSDETFANNYSVGGLFERLREDDAHNPDTMDQRYGAWAQLVVLFRLIYKGARHGKLSIPGRKGYLFDPDRYPFLEGRPNAKSQEIEIPRVPDGVLYRVLTQLLILDGERLSYRNLDVEQIGSVYEAMMGFELHLAQGPSIALKPKKRNGAPITINLIELLAVASAKRNEWLNKEADQKITGQAERALKEAGSVDDLIAALDRRIAKNVTPDPVLTGAMIFQPSAERRRSGSHYTPRSLTQPIVEAALAPVLKNLGENPKPEQILALKVCDPAMGSGAFLVEACRQIGDALVQAWHQHNDTPILPPDEDELLHARRLVAQRCLYGVDKNEMAVDLAKLSLWLATLARDHEFTFLDHALRHGDSLLGISARQIAAFDWEPNPSLSFLEGQLRRRIAAATSARKEILSAREGTPYAQLDQKLGKAEEQLGIVRNVGDVLAGAFFAGVKRPVRRNVLLLRQEQVRAAFGNPPDIKAGVSLETIAREQRQVDKPIVPFHWELEFPEVFDLDDNLRPQGGFDVVVGNPPFAGKNTINDASPEGYIDWLKILHAESHGNADLVAHFFRRAYNLLRSQGCFGLIATNTIAQGDTRSTGLRWICMQGGTIFRAVKRMKWPGEAKVVVSVVHIFKGWLEGPFFLNNRAVSTITAYLFHMGTSDNPAPLETNRNQSCRGCEIGSLGFLIASDDKDFTDLRSIADPRNQSQMLLKPYVGGKELNGIGTGRFVLDVDGLTKDELATLPRVKTILETRVYPDLLRRHEISTQTEEWWHFRRPSFGLREAQKLRRTIVTAQTSNTYAFIFIDPSSIFSHKTIGIISESMAMFCVVQSRIHQAWVLLQGSTMKDDPVYTPEDCFLTYPFPVDQESITALHNCGEEYYEYRAALLRRTGVGLTEVYNRFHNPEAQSPDLGRLRELHYEIDRAVLDAYGWSDIDPICDFFPEFDEEDEDDSPRPTRARQAKYRYRWHDEVHDEVLTRLLALNRERGQQQAETQRSIQDSPPKAKVTRKSKVATEPLLF